MDGGGRSLASLPDNCIADIVSFTGPLDACILSTVCSTFKDAVDSDTVWEKFLPQDYRSIISRSSDSSLINRFSSKKHLYFSLCDNPILIDDGKSFALEKRRRKKCYMLSARGLKIIWSDTPTYWRWICVPDSRFHEVAELISVCWLEISAKINTNMLSPSTLYTAYFVFKSTTRAYGFDSQPAEVAVGLVGSVNTRQQNVYLDAQRGRRRRPSLYSRVRNFGLQASVRNGESDCKYPKERGDGWLEIELGEFFIKGGEDEELQMSVLEVKGGHWKGGLVVQGIEIRPKNAR